LLTAGFSKTRFEFRGVGGFDQFELIAFMGHL
jgi:hypothetical protein